MCSRLKKYCELPQVGETSSVMTDLRRFSSFMTQYFTCHNSKKGKLQIYRCFVFYRFVSRNTNRYFLFHFLFFSRFLQCLIFFFDRDYI